MNYNTFRNVSAVLSSAIMIFSMLSMIPISAESNNRSFFRITNGTDQTASTNFDDIPSQVSKSGFRFYCRVSHFSYDDPIVYPGQSGKAHLHTFMGNTETDANSTVSSLKNSGKSSCTSGDLNKSAYWMPAVLDSNDQLVMPHFSKIYYKAHVQLEKTQAVPDNLQLIGSNDVKGCLEEPQISFDCAEVKNQNGELWLSVNFANCLQVRNGKPVLTSSDNTHGIFGYFSCPQSHPYRIPMISMNLEYKINPNSNWKLSSDVMDPKNPKPKGSTLHADIITAWTDKGRQDILNCNRRGQNCQLWMRDESADKNPEGKTIYEGMKLVGDNTTLGSPSATLTDHSKMSADSIKESASEMEMDIMTEKVVPVATISTQAQAEKEVEKQIESGKITVPDAIKKNLPQWKVRKAQGLRRRIRRIESKIQQLEKQNQDLKNQVQKLES